MKKTRKEYPSMFAIKEVPFSRAGSYWAVCQGEESQVYLRDLHGGDEAVSNLYVLLFANELGKEIANEDLTIDCSEEELTITDRQGGKVRCCFGENQMVCFLTQQMQVTIEAVKVNRYDTMISVGRNRLEHTLYSKNRKVYFTCLYGEMVMEGNWNQAGTAEAKVILQGKTNNCLMMENVKSELPVHSYLDYEQVKDQTSHDYESWKNRFPEILKTSPYLKSFNLARYLLWTNQVEPCDALTRQSIYCSKNWMNNIWSWDNCFTAIALSDLVPDLAYDQLAVFYSLQEEVGCYPDYINDRFASFSCCKPPIHAWTYRKMLAQNGEYFGERQRFTESYESFCKVADYWLNHRVGELGLPEYHHGNDSGWDNASVFSKGVPVVLPDLTAHLIRQLDTLADFAAMLGREEESLDHREKANLLYETMMDTLFDGTHFFGRLVETGEKIIVGHSLILYLPLVVGYRMEAEIRDRLVKELKTDFLTNAGLATESPKSPYYKEKGYWLGPVWAPVTYLMIDALRQIGYDDFAEDLAFRFLECTRVGKMAENFDAKTMEGCDDPAFAWTSAVFLQLYREYERPKERNQIESEMD